MIKEALDAYALSSNKIWSHDRSQTIGASEIGQCARKVFWTKNEGDPKYGVERDPEYVESYGARVRGTIMENEFWFPAMQAKFGERLKFAGPDQKTFVSSFLSATPDGLITELHPGELAGIDATCVTAECKSADPRTNLNEAKAENVYQTHVQMGLIREQTKHQPTHSVLSYMDASFWNEVKEFVIPFDPAIYETAKRRAALIMTATEAGELKPEGWIAGGRECEYCPFTKACGIQRRSVPEGNVIADRQFAAEIADLALTAKRFELARDNNESAMREAQQAIRDRLRSHGVRKIPGVVNWSHVKGRVSYNNKAIQEAAIAAGIDIEIYSTVGEPTDRLTISLAPPNGDAETQTANAA